MLVSRKILRTYYMHYEIMKLWLSLDYENPMKLHRVRPFKCIHNFPKRLSNGTARSDPWNYFLVVNCWGMMKQDWIAGVHQIVMSAVNKLRYVHWGVYWGCIDGYFSDVNNAVSACFRLHYGFKSAWQSIGHCRRTVFGCLR